jgi:protein-S-isoprenylcysteine O-methyltransferase Ste14
MELSIEQEQNKSLVSKVIIRYTLSFIILSCFIFIPAGTIDYFNGWFLLGLMLLPSISILIYLYTNDKELLYKRMNTKEKEKPQKIVLIISLFAFPAIFIVSGLDFRLGWSEFPSIIVYIAGMLILFGDFIFFLVMRQNSYASRVVEIQEGQKLIRDGVYGIVRHPMYTGAIFMFVAIPLVLGSYYGLIPVFLIPLIFILRIYNEEKVLSEGLPGYIEYKKDVRYRLLPYIW